MAIPVNNYVEFDNLVRKLWSRAPLFGFVLHDSRLGHKPVALFLKKNAEWLDELARQSQIYILFPLRKQVDTFQNPSPEIARKFGLSPERLPGIILLATGEDSKDLPSSRFLFIPLAATDFSDHDKMESILSDLFSIVQRTLTKEYRGSEALTEIRKMLSKDRRQKKKHSLIQNLRKGAHIVIIKFPAKLLLAFAEGVGKAMGSGAIQ